MHNRKWRFIRGSTYFLPSRSPPNLKASCCCTNVWMASTSLSIRKQRSSKSRWNLRKVRPIIKEIGPKKEGLEAENGNAYEVRRADPHLPGRGAVTDLNANTILSIHQHEEPRLDASSQRLSFC